MGKDLERVRGNAQMDATRLTYALLIDRPSWRLPWVLGIAVVILGTAEILTAGPAVPLGLVLHGVLLLGLLTLHVVTDSRESELYLAMAVLPLIRILSDTMPLVLPSEADWFALVNVPLIVGTLVAARSLRYGRPELGLRLGRFPIQIAIAYAGLAIGPLEHLIIQPPAIVSGLALRDLAWPMTSLLLFTGLSEELLFRGVLLTASIRTLGPLRGILFDSLVFALMHIGWHSALDVLYVFVVGVGFAVAVYRTGSILGTSLAHGLANVFLFILLPFR